MTDENLSFDGAGHQARHICTAHIDRAPARPTMRDLATFNTAVRECMDLLSRCRGFGELHRGFQRDAGEGFGTSLLKLLGIKPMHDPPSFATDRRAFANAAQNLS
jgi:hypothetical protein